MTTLEDQRLDGHTDAEDFQRARRETEAGDLKNMSQQMGSGELADLVQQMEQSEDDPRQCYALVKQRISEFRHSGRDIPDELSKLEKSLMTECMLASQGR